MSESKNVGPAKNVWQVLIAAISGLLGFLVALFFRRRKDGNPIDQPEVVHLGTTITLPPNNQKGGRPLIVVERDLPAVIPQSTDPKNPDEFVPQRMFVNFEIVDAQTRLPVTDFSDSPIKAQFTYSEEQVKAAQRLVNSGSEHAKILAANTNMPILGFWDGTHWIKFTKDKHHLSYSSEITSGIATVVLTNWADPPLGWFPP